MAAKLFTMWALARKNLACSAGYSRADKLFTPLSRPLKKSPNLDVFPEILKKSSKYHIIFFLISWKNPKYLLFLS